MKTTLTFKTITLVALLGATLVAPVFAQGGAGSGGGWGGGPCMQNAGGGMRNGGGMGMGPGARGGQNGRAMMASSNTTPGWALMTADERVAFQTRMRDVKTYDECVQTQTDHRGLMEVRAKEKSVSLRTPRQNICDNLKARGQIQ